MLYIRGGNSGALQERLFSLCRQYQKVLVIVPEQFTLQTERDLIAGLSAPGFFDIEVLSPSRLTERVFAAAGQDGFTRIDDRGKQMALARVLMDEKKHLRYFESAAQKQGFIQRMGMIIANFKQAGVSPEELTAYAESLEDGAHKDKLTDLSRIYAGYCTLLSGQFVDGDDVTLSMLQRLPQSGIASGCAVCIWGFDIYLGQTIRLICALAQEALHTEALLVLSQEEAFAPVWDSALRLKTEAEKMGISCSLSQLKEAAEQKTPALSHLSREYFSINPRLFPAPQEALRLYAAPTPFFEAHFMAAQMLQLHEKGMPFSDMAVVLGDESFAGTLKEVLSSYRIPCYVGQKMPASRHGAARFLIATLRAMAEGYPENEMLNVIKSGYAPLMDKQCWQLENYILSYGIRGKKWLAPFERGEEEEKTAADEARQMLIGPMENLRLSLKEADNAQTAITHVFRYLEETRVYAALLYNQEQLLARDMPAEAVQCRQVWQMMLRILEQAYALWQEGAFSAARLSIALEAALESCELSSLPPSAGCVMCGRIGSLPLSQPRVLFAACMTEGIAASSRSSLLSEDEQIQLESRLQARLTLSDEGQDQLKQLDIWKCLNAPSEKLFLSYALATQDGTALRPYSGIRKIKKMFPALVEEGGMMQKNPVMAPLSLKAAMSGMGLHIRSHSLDGEWLEAWKYLCANDSTRAQALSLQKSFLPQQEAAPLPRDVTHNLFMERIMSVSRLESFAVCPYKHFVEIGLHPQPRKEWKLTPIDAGNFYHSALEGFTRLLPTLPKWPHIDKKTCDQLIEQAAKPLFEKHLSGVMGDSARMRAVGEKYRKVLKRVAWTFTKAARQSDFTTVQAEVRFGYEHGIPPIALTLKDGSVVYVRGVIDRIDRYAGDEGIFLRVVDYKSGNAKLTPAQVFWGAQLQLLLYLKAALSMESEAEPAGAFYMHVADPLLATEKEQEEIEDELAKMLQLKGVALKDVAILQRMDNSENHLSLPKMTTKDGFDKRSALASLSDMHSLIRHAASCAADLSEKMHSGLIKAAPLCGKNDNGPCDFCDYASVCRKNAGNSPESIRHMEDMSFSDLLEKINQPQV